MGPENSQAVLRYRADDLLSLATALFRRVGLSDERSRRMADVFLQADLLGYSTHGLNRVSSNLRWLEQGETRADGEPKVLADTGSCLNWDANFLPGPVVVSQAVGVLLQRARQHGVATAVIRRSQHIACLAAYLPAVVEAGFVGILSCSTPAENTVSPHGSRDPLLSANPIAFCAPAEDYPLLFDISMSVIAGGYVARAKREGESLPGDYLRDRDGQLTNDPAVFDEGGSILPVGGADHGYKGAALGAMIEVLSMALGGYGRADAAAAGDDEANSVFLQIIDPAAFGARGDFLRQTRALCHLWENCRGMEGAVRVPGQGAWARRTEQLQQGVSLYPTIMEDILPWAEKLGVPVPMPIAE